MLKAKNSLYQQLNKMPIAKQSEQIKARRVELEKTIEMIENNIELFSKKVVFVKINN